VPSFAEVSDVSFSFGAGVAIGRAWVWSSNIFKFTVKIHEALPLLLKIYDLLKHPTYGQGKSPWVGDM